MRAMHRGPRAGCSGGCDVTAAPESAAAADLERLSSAGSALSGGFFVTGSVSRSAVNGIDRSALLGLLELDEALKARGIGLTLAEAKGPVLDRLKTSALLSELNGRLFLSTAMAWETLASHGNDLQA